MQKQEVLSEFNGNNVQEHNDERQELEYVSDGSKELIVARKYIARFSLEKARSRISKELIEAELPLPALIRHRKATNESLKSFTMTGSQFGGERALGIVRCSPDAMFAAVGSWSSSIRVFKISSLSSEYSFLGHEGLIGGIAWNPFFGSQSQTPLHLASGGGDGKLCFWSCGRQDAIVDLKAHDQRIAHIDFHPSGKYVGTASYDRTWKLWDVETHRNVLVQDGHSGEVHALCFSPDGSLCSTGDKDAIGRVWDLRTGKTMMLLDGHSREILGLDWDPNGFQLLSASGDGSVKAWDLRMIKCISTIAAHNQLVSDVRFYKKVWTIQQFKRALY